MAITAAVGSLGAITPASTAGISFPRDLLRPYTLYHTGKDAAGAAASGLVAVGVGANPTAADWSEEANKIVLEAGAVAVVPSLNGQQVALAEPGKIYLKSAAGAPMIQVVGGEETLR